MLMTIAIASILAITGLIRFAKKILPFPVCPICAGVSGTWIWMILAHGGGYQIDLTVPAILMGGSVVAAMFKLERFVKPKFVLVWKTAFVASGFWAANGLITGNWLILVTGIIFAVLVTLAFKMRRIKENKPGSEKIEELKKKMRNCC